jgi:threonyl-tRNA synthetase
MAKDKKALETLRHSASHVLAHAVKDLFPKVKLGIGPSIEDGFYYDFEKKEPFTPEDLKKIAKRMKEIVKEDQSFKCNKVSPIEAKKLLKDEPYKLDLLKDLIKLKQKPSFYTNGKFTDLCSGPHVKSTREVRAFKLLKTAGAYWRGDSKNRQLQRIYGTAFFSKDELKAHIRRLEEAEKRDHNKLGRRLGLFITSEFVGQGLPLFTPKGTKILKILQNFVEDEEEKRGYLLTMTPIMAKSDLYKISGHWDHYKEGMFIIENAGDEMALRPMTCPFQFQIYKSQKRSYRDLPIKYNETSTLFRNEESGEMHGLIRLRQFTISEGHIICTMDQLAEEFANFVDLTSYILNTLGLKDFWYRFSKRDPNNKKGKYIDNPKAWEQSEKNMKKILDKLKLKYVEADDEAAFYGPKLDIQMKNVHGKEDTLITIQVDFALPERFDMKYTDENNNEKRPIVIHRTSIGCYERTLALLIEHYAGKFPLWLSPVHVRLLPIADRHVKYGKEVMEKMRTAGLRVEIDDKALTMGKKIRNAQVEQVNYILVIGDNEKKNKTVNVRTRDNKVHGEKKVDKFIQELLKEVESRK